MEPLQTDGNWLQIAPNMVSRHWIVESHQLVLLLRPKIIISFSNVFIMYLVFSVDQPALMAIKRVLVCGPHNRQRDLEK